MTPMKRVAVRWLCMGVMAWVAGAGVAQATLVLEGTRIVYPEKAKDVSIRVRNPGSYPILAQSWLDDEQPGFVARSDGGALYRVTRPDQGRA